ncbi:hypothetical protein Avbf_13038 [Armadillidium vulgare]|nr:hypothetical protein Avbf_13038 [Armadillidium vulgare]
MKLIILAVTLAVATALPSLLDGSSSHSHDQSQDHIHEHSPENVEYVKILRDERQGPEDGSYSFDIETEDGIIRSETGTPLNIDQNPTGQQGNFKLLFNI